MRQRLLLIIIVLMAIPSLFANDFSYTYQGQTLRYTTYGSKCAVAEGNEVSGDVVIPDIAVDSLGHSYPVIQIGDYAFNGCSGLSSVVLGDSITKIGRSAFFGCNSLTSVTISNSVTEMGSNAFTACLNLSEVNISSLESWCKIKFSSSLSNPLYYAHNLILNGGLVTDLVIPDSITEINNSAFAGGSCLNSVTFSRLITKVGANVFFGCTELKEVRTSSLEQWCGIAFENKWSNPLVFAHNLIVNGASVKNLVVPSSISVIHDYAFHGCTGISSVTIPNSVTSIGVNAFEDCSGLTAVNISSLDSWFGINFGNSLSNPVYYAHNLLLNGELIRNLVIPESVSKIKNYVFEGCREITSVTLPNSMTEIGDNAFSGNAGITSFILGNSVAKIGSQAFSGCTGLTSVTIPNSVKEIGSAAFINCTGLKEVKISSLESWCNIDFATYHSNPLFYANDLYLNGVLIEDLSIPENISEIKDFAFIAGSKLKSVTIPNSVTKIGKNAFAGCSKIPAVEIPNSVSEIEEYAFDGCSGLKSVSFPASLKLIGVSAFQHCSGLTSVEIPNSVTAIADYTFANCPGLTSVTIPNSVTEIGTCAFYMCYSLKSLAIPNSVTLIGYEAFRGCMSLTSITVPNSVTLVGAGSFNGCTNLTSVTIPNSVTAVAAGSFLGCPNISSVICFAQVPPAISINTFEQSVYSKATLSVTESYESVYQEDPIWSLFAINSIKFANSISFNVTEWTGFEGDSFTLSATITPDNAYDKTLLWRSDAPEVATVNSNGVVRAIAEGSANITATMANGLSATCAVTVKARPIAVAEIELSAQELLMVEDETTQLIAEVKPDNATDKTVTWSSSDEAVAIVDENGIVKAVKAGSAVITATASNGLKATCPVAVSAKIIDVIGLTLNMDDVELTEGETVQLTATIEPENVTDKTVVWSSSEPSVASVDENGNVTAVQGGTAVITASASNGITASCTVTVSAITVDAAGLTINAEMVELTAGDTMQLTATVEPENATDKTVTWSSSEPSVVSVDENGNIAAIMAGSAIITASTANGLTAVCLVTVLADEEEAPGLILNIEEVDLSVDETVQLEATICVGEEDVAVTWVSSAPSVAIVDENIRVIAINEGTAIITASAANGMTASCTVNVTAQTTGIQGVAGDRTDSVRVDGNSIVAPDGSAIYNLNGRRVKATNLPSGIYIVRIPGGKAVKVRVK